MVAFRHQRSISVVAAVAAAVSGRRRLLVDLLLVAAGVPDLLRVPVLAENLSAVVVAVVVLR